MKLSRWLLMGSAVSLAGWMLSRYSHSPISAVEVRDSVVLITGASSGIGRAFAIAFARRGAKVVLAARRVELLEAVREEILPFAADVLVVLTDVTDPLQLQALVEATLKQYNRIDVLINNAGVPSGGLLHTIPHKVIAQTVATNLTAAVTLTHMVLPTMLSQQSGWIINISSILGGIGFPFYSVYSTTKHGLVAFSNILRRELDGTGVGVISVMPSWTDTDMMAPDVQKSMNAAGITIDTASHVAERTIEGMFDGKTDIYFGGLKMRMGFWLERHFPAMMDWYFRATMTPQHIAMSRGG
jgi:short-subunit dehydrogenase